MCEDLIGEAPHMGVAVEVASHFQISLYPLLENPGQVELVTPAAVKLLTRCVRMFEAQHQQQQEQHPYGLTGIQELSPSKASLAACRLLHALLSCQCVHAGEHVRLVQDVVVPEKGVPALLDLMRAGLSRGANEVDLKLQLVDVAAECLETILREGGEEAADHVIRYDGCQILLDLASGFPPPLSASDTSSRRALRVMTVMLQYHCDFRRQLLTKEDGLVRIAWWADNEPELVVESLHNLSISIDQAHAHALAQVSDDGTARHGVCCRHILCGSLGNKDDEHKYMVHVGVLSFSDAVV